MIVVIGASGFVGRYLVDLFASNGIPVLACGRSKKCESFFNNLNVPYVQLDVTKPEDFEKLPKAEVDAVIHLSALIPAAVPDVNTDLFLKVNTLGTFYSLEYCRKNRIPKFLFTTTLYEGIEHTKLPVSEADGRRFSMVGDHAAYVISKIAAADYVEHYREEHGLQTIIFRFTGLLGLGRQEGYFLNGEFHPSAFEVFYRRAKEGKTLEIWGNHLAKRDALYVKDAVRAILMAIQSKKAQGLYVIGSGIGRTVEEEVKIFAEVFGTPTKPIKIEYMPSKPDKDKSYFFDITKARNEFGWQPMYGFSDILRDYDMEARSARFCF